MRLAPLAVVLALLAFPSLAQAQADPSQDFQLIYADYTGADGTTPNDIQSCRWTRQQLVNARTVAQGSADFAYYTGFISELNAEIARYDSGFCAGVVPDPGGQSGIRLAITRIRAKGGKRESVTIKNVGPRAVRLRPLRLRDKQRSSIRLPRFTLKRGRSLRVTTGCFRKARKPRRRGGRFYACKRRAIWGNRGDVVKIVGGRGTVLAQRGYGRFRGVPRF